MQGMLVEHAISLDRHNPTNKSSSQYVYKVYQQVKISPNMNSSFLMQEIVAYLFYVIQFVQDIMPYVCKFLQCFLQQLHFTSTFQLNVAHIITKLERKVIA
jgi:hypothetical protein